MSSKVSLAATSQRTGSGWSGSPPPSTSGSLTSRVHRITASGSGSPDATPRREQLGGQAGRHRREGGPGPGCGGRPLARGRGGVVAVASAAPRGDGRGHHPGQEGPAPDHGTGGRGRFARRDTRAPPSCGRGSDAATLPAGPSGPLAARSDRPRSAGEGEAQVGRGARVQRRRAVGPQPPPAGGGDHRRVVGAHRPAGHEGADAVLVARLDEPRRAAALLAATPPPRHRPLAPTSLAARRALVTSTSTTASWKQAATSAADTSGCLRTWVTTAVLSPLKLNVVPVVAGAVDHPPREAGSPRGRRPRPAGR